MKFGFLYGYAALITLSACSSPQSETKEEEGVETILPMQKNEVTVMKLTKGDFHHELVSNGKITARESADLYFRTTEVVEHVWVKNGDFVRKGQKLAQLNLFKLNNALTQSKNALAQATLDMQDVLIGQGYAPDNMDAIPEDVLQLAKVKSGYDRTVAQYEAAQHDVEQATLTAPFDGVVANLFDKAYNLSKNGTAFCRILSTNGMEADFTVLESELPLIRMGDKVEVTPYASDIEAQSGHVCEINPLVDANGMVRVKARVNGGRNLFDGMNVRVSVKRTVPNQFVVPKTAVVLRSGKQVLFTLQDSLALWNYVQTGLENMTEYTVQNADGTELLDGTVVITTGNVNLAHESVVKVK